MAWYAANLYFHVTKLVFMLHLLVPSSVKLAQTSSERLHTQVQSVDAVIHFGDLPIAPLAAVPDSPPLFSYASNADFAEIPFPDWTYWGSTGTSQQRTWQVIPATLVRAQ